MFCLQNKKGATILHIEFSGTHLFKKKRKAIEESIYKLFGFIGLDEFSVSVNIVNETEIRDLQLRFGKQVGHATDVLSFPLPPEEKNFEHTKNMLGDIVICIETAEKQALELGHKLIDEIAVLCAHGLFHLLGLDHEKSPEEASKQMQAEMFLLEQAGFRPEICLIGRTSI